MKRCCSIGLLLGCALGVVAQSEPARPFPPGEVVCGYAGNYVAQEAVLVKQGLSVELLAGDAAVAQPIPLRFRVTEQPRGTPVDDLQIEHEKHMHVIGVREDLGAFIHLHPQRATPGLWEIVHAFAEGGRYQLWSDIKHRGTVYSFAHPRLFVAGETPSDSRERAPQLSAETDGFHLTLQPASATLIAGRTNAFEVIVRDRFGNVIGTDFFLGALMHLIIVKDNLTVYAHAHAREHMKARGAVSFQHVFARPGFYKIFAQFRPQKSKLPPDEASLAEFWVRVERGN